MGFSHKYDLIKEADDSGKEVFDDIKEEPRHTSTPVVTSWWKLLLCNLVAAAVGAGVMFFIAQGFATPKPTPTTTTSSNVVIPSTPAGLSDSSTASLDELAASSTAIPNMAQGEILDCGGNPTEAREKGCVYDVMMQDWVPEPCYDSALTERYLEEGNWTWYGDGEGKSTFTLDEMRKGEHGAAWMSTSYHKAHCVFSWLKIIRALRNNHGISQELLSYDHVLHCKHGALKGSSEDEGLGVKAPTNYAKCALYETWKQDFIPDKHDSAQR